jgi:hypothetical protein
VATGRERGNRGRERYCGGRSQDPHHRLASKPLRLVCPLGGITALGRRCARAGRGRGRGRVQYALHGPEWCDVSPPSARGRRPGS